tara:strand:+ start:814 stop:939 length:126 start_codon:yes stop_codon:yes gene_type:complete
MSLEMMSKKRRRKTEELRKEMKLNQVAMKVEEELSLKKPRE